MCARFRKRIFYVRLFVAVWPPASVLESLEALRRREEPTIRWTTRDQWHVTLRFLGDVEDPGPASEALARVPELYVGARPVPASLGPATAWFPGRKVLQVPVEGLDELAKAVDEALGPGPLDDGDFSGHLTIARARGRSKGPPDLAGARCEGTWEVRHVTLVASRLGGSGSRYEVVSDVAL